MNVFIIEIQLVDYPEYETFVGVKRSFEEAESFVISHLEQEIADLGEDDEFVKTQVFDDQVKYEIDGGSVMFITKHEV